MPDMVELYQIGLAIFGAVWIMIPAALTNSIAVFFGGKTPIDNHRLFYDGRRIFGNGKTWKGLVSGILVGFVAGLIAVTVDYCFGNHPLFFGEFPNFFLIIFLLPFGALMGDMLGSFIKRRLNVQPGEKLRGMDQYDWVIGAWLLLVIVQPLYFYQHFIEGWHILGLIVVLILTPIAHRATNVFGYKKGFKDVPW